MNPPTPKCFLLSTLLVLGAFMVPFAGEIAAALHSTETIDPGPEPDPDPEPDPEPEPQPEPGPVLTERTIVTAEMLDEVSGSAIDLPADVVVAVVPDDAAHAGQPPEPATFDPARSLPAAEAQIFETLRAAGMQLAAEGVPAPKYRTDTSFAVIDALRSKGLIRLAVLPAHRTHLFVFDGGLTRPGRARLARSTDSRGFAARMVFLDEDAQSAPLIRSVRDTFPGERGDLEAVVITRADLDAVVHAVQAQAAAALGIPLESIRKTTGRWRMHAGIPFAYEIEQIVTDDSVVSMAGK